MATDERTLPKVTITRNGDNSYRIDCEASWMGHLTPDEALYILAAWIVGRRALPYLRTAEQHAACERQIRRPVVED